MTMTPLTSGRWHFLSFSIGHETKYIALGGAETLKLAQRSGNVIEARW